METEVKKYQVAKYKKRITRASQNMGIKQAKGNSSELLAIKKELLKKNLFTQLL